jgi:hypothetical protein
MRLISWLVFLAFIGLSAFANYAHGQDALAGFLLAIVPVGFAVVVFLYEALHAAGRVTRLTTAAAVVVGGGAGVASYLGLFGMAREHGVQLVPALLLPLAFDGVVAVASMGIRGFAFLLVPPAVAPAEERSPIPASVPHDVPPVLPAFPAFPEIEDHATATVPGVLPVTDTVPEAGNGRGDGVPRLQERSPDAQALWERFGADLPPVRELKQAMGWGGTRTSNAVRSLRASIEGQEAQA